MNLRAARGVVFWTGMALASQLLAGAAGAQPADAPAGAGTETSTFAAQLGAGAGVGARDVSLPTSEGERRVTTGLFPALDVDLRAEGVLGDHALLGARLRYQTSIGLSGTETPYGGVPRETTLRSHHIDVGLAPGYRFTRSPRSVALSAFAGFNLRAVSTVIALTVPDYTLYGPIARLELRVPLGSERAVLRLSPELIAWFGASESLRAAGALDHAGLALGGEASLYLQLARPLALELAYRGSRGSIASGHGGSFTDTEHYITGQVAVAY